MAPDISSMSNSYANSGAGGTAAAAKLFLAFFAIGNATNGSAVVESTPVVPLSSETSIAPNGIIPDAGGMSTGSVAALISIVPKASVAQSWQRATTGLEELIGEIRGWALWEADWDGEGAMRPVAESLVAAVAFVRVFDGEVSLPDPMLHSDGCAGLFWKSQSLYADLKFLADGNIAYFVEHNDMGKHKGIVKFDGRSVPAVFPAIIRS